MCLARIILSALDLQELGFSYNNKKRLKGEGDFEIIINALLELTLKISDTHARSVTL